MTQRFFIIKCEPQSIESLPLVGRTSTQCDGAHSYSGGETMTRETTIIIRKLDAKTAAKAGVAAGWSWTIKADDGGCQEFGLPTYRSAVESVLRLTPETA